MEWEENENRRLFEEMVEATNVKEIWQLSKFIQETPPWFELNYELSYSLLAILAAAELRFAVPVYINKKMIGELFDVPGDSVEEHLRWLTNIGIIQKC